MTTAYTNAWLRPNRKEIQKPLVITRNYYPEDLDGDFMYNGKRYKRVEEILGMHEVHLHKMDSDGKKGYFKYVEEVDYNNVITAHVTSEYLIRLAHMND